MSTRLDDIIHGLESIDVAYTEFTGCVDDEYEHARAAVQSMILLLKGAIAP